MKRGLGDKLGKALRTKDVPAWAFQIAAEYDRGPVGQLSRAMFVQSLFDRM
jgi:hypothetical protein